MKNPYLPELARIINFRDETPDTRTFEIEPISNDEIRGMPGQFVEVMVFGYGEAPFSISGIRNHPIELTVRRIGTVTNALFKLSQGDIVGVRGPFGRGWPLEKLFNKNILIIAGGIGLAPLRPLIHFIINNRYRFGNVDLLYGARTPELLLYKDELERWSREINVHLTVDKPEPEWRGRVGVVTILFDEIDIDPSSTIALQCGPPIMMHFVTRKLRELGFSDNNIYLSLERLMKCGMGMCGKCTVSGTYVCLNGPVFQCREIRGFIERVPEIGE